MILEPGARLGPYEIVALLGAGGMGEVYRARDTRPALSRDVAIKVLAGAALSDESRRRFEHEARATSALNHPNILAIYDVGVHDGTLYLVEELIDGITLREALTTAPLPLRRILEYARAIAQGLAAAHAKGIVHRDLKPENVMLTADGHVKLLDFGLAKQQEPATPSDDSTQSHATNPGTVLGTVSYMSPEQVRGQTLDHRSDIFSLGVVLYEMLGGERPFAGETPPDTQAAILNAEPRELTPTRGVPPALERVVRRCLEKRPDQRFQSASDLAFALDALSSLPNGSGAQSLLSAADEAPRSDVTVLVGLLRRHPAWSAGAGLAACALIGLALFLAVGRTPRLDAPQRGSQDSGVTRADYDVAQLTTGGNASRPAASPDGKYIAYVQQDGREQSLWLQQIASGSNVQLVTAERGQPIDGMTISPDSTFVDFVRGTGNARHLWRVPFLGGTPRRILSNVDTAPSWSPDGQHFAFVRGVNDLVVADPDGQRQREVLRVQQGLGLGSFAVVGTPSAHPAWDPSGHTLVTSASDSGIARLVFVGADGQNRRDVTLTNEVREAVVWPRSNEVLLVTSPSGAENKQIFRLNPADERLTRLTNDVSTYSGLSVTADGRALVSAKVDLKAGVWVAESPGLRFSELVSPFAFSSAPRNFRIAWSGSDLLYQSTTGGTLSVWKFRPSEKGRGERIVSGRSVAASADGASLFVVGRGRPGTTMGLWRTASDGTGEQELDSGQFGASPAPSRDGKSVVFVSNREGDQSLWVLDTDTRTAQRLTRRFAGASGAVFSPDESRLLFRGRAADNSSVFVVCDMPGCTNQIDIPIDAISFRWTPDGRDIAFVKRDTQSNIFIRSLDHGTTRQLTTFPEDAEITDFAWSADGRRLAVARVFTSSDVVMFRREQP